MAWVRMGQLLARKTKTDNSKSEIQGFFAPLRMTTQKQIGPPAERLWRFVQAQEALTGMLFPGVWGCGRDAAYFGFEPGVEALAEAEGELEDALVGSEDQDVARRVENR